MSNEFKYMFNMDAKCPHCDFDDDGVWELGLQGDGDETENECPNCEEEYMVELNLEISYTTSKIKE